MKRKIHRFAFRFHLSSFEVPEGFGIAFMKEKCTIDASPNMSPSIHGLLQFRVFPGFKRILPCCAQSRNHRCAPRVIMQLVICTERTPCNQYCARFSVDLPPARSCHRLIPASFVGVLAWGHVAISGNDPNALGSALFSIFIGLWTT